MNDLNSSARDAGQAPPRLAIVAVVAVTLALRLLHLGAALRSPLTFQPGPDEDFYSRFAQAVAFGTAGDDPQWGFMDPAYGYLLGIMFKVAGPNLFAVFLFQILVDTLTAWCIFLIGRELGRPRGGLFAALLYGLTSTVILFPTTLLKATWAANFMTLWVLFGLLLLRARPFYVWAAFGIFCGYGVALRSNLLLMAGMAVVLLPWLQLTLSKQSLRDTALHAFALVAGLSIPLALLALRNHEISAGWSPLPTNGGIVLHQVYNADNPRALTWIPPFANYSHPSEIWRGYSEEAQRRAGRPLRPHEVSQYWRGEAVAYIAAHPADVAQNVARKFTEFVAYTEIPNNRSLVEERLFSPVLRVLPSPFGWLLALGTPGIALLLWRDRRGLLILAPVLCTAFTVSVFFAEDRFRFHAVPMFALGGGLFVEELYLWLRQRRLAAVASAALAAAALGAASVALAQRSPPQQVSWTRIVWGYLRMGNTEAATAAASRAAKEQPDNPTVQEALGFIAAKAGRYTEATEHYRRAVELKPNSHIARYNLAKMLAKVGDRRGAAKEAEAALQLSPLPDYRKLLDELTATQ
jgi:4-amino-4-deoxy-L-arabinose transferase-like glycosyltransferase